MTQFADSRCGACGHVRLQHYALDGWCGQCHENFQCQKFVQQPVSSNQDAIASWVRSTLGDEVAKNAHERCLRAAEEVIELAQACGQDAATIHRLVDYVFNRPAGKPAQEIAGSLVSLYAVAAALGIDAQAEFETELERIRSPEVIERVRRRQSEKREALSVPVTELTHDELCTLSVTAPNLACVINREPPHEAEATRHAARQELAALLRLPPQKVRWECPCGRQPMHANGWCGICVAGREALEGRR